MPGATPNAAPAAWTSFTCCGVRIVPTPTTSSGTSARMQRSAVIATGVRRVSSMQSTPPASNARASGTASSAASTTSTAMTPERWRRWGRVASVIMPGWCDEKWWGFKGR